MKKIKLDHAWEPVFALLSAIVLLPLISLVLTGCSQIEQLLPQIPKQKLSLETLYRRDILVTVNGVTREGMITMPLQPVNHIHVTAASDLDLFVVEDCVGESVKPQAWNVQVTQKSGLFNWFTETIDKKREAQWDFVPAGRETRGACPIFLHAFAKDGQHSTGMIDFRSPDFTLHGTLMCNGEQRPFGGDEACQTRVGKFAEVHFFEEVTIDPDAGCELGAKSFKDLEFRMPRGDCVYRVKGKDTGLIGKFYTYGYDGILIRSN